MSKFKRNIKRVFCIILLVIFSPAILLYLIIRGITKSMRKRTWKKKGLSGKQLVLATDINIIDKMEDFEAFDYFKYLFFFDGYSVKNLTTNKKHAQFLLLKNGEEILLKYIIYKGKMSLSDIKSLKLQKENKGYKKALFICNMCVTDMIKEEYFKENIKILDRSELITFYERVKRNLKINTSTQEVSGKTMKQMLDEMYPNSI